MSILFTIQLLFPKSGSLTPIQLLLRKSESLTDTPTRRATQGTYFHFVTLFVFSKCPDVPRNLGNKRLVITNNWQSFDPKFGDKYDH
ncbi:hypothetical protein DFH08DRAFT_1084527 [Mycena albidolilacea]|uniref:Uncharacterized protein n=1 Tax=Mycena albidolilacea TaxID=1033008 RepID=A0AAD6ZM04_9AGAR|nr:hypothetical protein DFH08DRAFT_1084527 [Mycena albidolilacea]